MRTFCIDNQEEWTPWFAWRPVYIKQDRGWIKVWRETIERKLVVNVGDTYWIYRLPEVP